MNLRKRFALLFGLEVASVAFAIVCFRLLPDRTLAGSLAGMGFLLVSLKGMRDVSRMPRRNRYFSFYLFPAFLFAVVLPMLIGRALQSGNFEQVRILALTGPEFHRLSEVVFLILMVCTLIDGYRAKL